MTSATAASPPTFRRVLRDIVARGTVYRFDYRSFQSTRKFTGSLDDRAMDGACGMLHARWQKVAVHSEISAMLLGRFPSQTAWQTRQKAAMRSVCFIAFKSLVYKTLTIDVLPMNEFADLARNRSANDVSSMKLPEYGCTTLNMCSYTSIPGLTVR